MEVNMKDRSSQDDSSGRQELPVDGVCSSFQCISMFRGCKDRYRHDEDIGSKSHQVMGIVRIITDAVE